MNDRLQRALGVLGDLTAIGAALADALKRQDMKRVDEILAGELATSAALKAERLKTIEEIEGR